MHILKNRKIVSRQMLAALDDAGLVLEEARRLSRQTVDEAREEARRIRDDAQREGFEQGKAEATQILCQARRRREAMLKAFERDIIDLAVEAAALLVRRARAMDPAVVAEVYGNALARLPSAGRIRLRVSPADFETARALLAGGMLGAAAGGAIDVERDGAVSEGGCIVESDAGKVDARLETQLEAIRSGLTKELEAGDESESRP